MDIPKFKVNDRVRRRPYKVAIPLTEEVMNAADEDEVASATVTIRGCIGTVKAVREETTLAPQEGMDRTLMVQVLWDDGTLAVHGVEGIELA